MENIERKVILSITEKKFGGETLLYSVFERNGMFGIEIKCGSERGFDAGNVSDGFAKIQNLYKIFSRNLVFPENAAEMFDEGLAMGLV